MEMTQEMIEKYGEANMKVLEEYRSQFLPNGVNTKLPETPKDIPVGTVLTQYWLNSMTYYMVTRTTKKGVEFIEMLDKQIGFDSDGGGTGTRYCLPDFVKTMDNQKKYQHFVESTGLDIFNTSREKIDRLSKEDKKIYFDIMLSRGCSKKIFKLVKPTKDGGFYIPGVHTGKGCGSMKLWDGTPCREYYGD